MYFPGIKFVGHCPIFTVRKIIVFQRQIKLRELLTKCPFELQYLKLPFFKKKTITVDKLLK